MTKGRTRYERENYCHVHHLKLLLSDGGDKKYHCSGLVLLVLLRPHHWNLLAEYGVIIVGRYLLSHLSIHSPLPIRIHKK